MSLIKLFTFFLLFLGTQAFAVNNLPPIAYFESDKMGPILSGSYVTLNASRSYSPNGHLVKFEWYINDVLERTDESFRFNYVVLKTVLGSKQTKVKLVVTDNNGQKTSFEREFHVVPNIVYYLKEQDKESSIYNFYLSAGERYSIINWVVNDNPLEYVSSSSVNLSLANDRDHEIKVRFRGLDGREQSAIHQIDRQGEKNESRRKDVYFMDCISQDNYVVSCASERIVRDRNTTDKSDPNYDYDYEDGNKYFWTQGENEFKGKKVYFNFQDGAKKDIDLKIIGRNENLIGEAKFVVKPLSKAGNADLIKNNFAVVIDPANKWIQDVMIHELITLDSSIISLKNNETYHYEWFINGVVQKEKKDRITARFEKEGDYKITLSVKDSNGQIRTDDIVLRVSAVYDRKILDSGFPLRIRYQFNSEWLKKNKVIYKSWSITPDSKEFRDYYGSSDDETFELTFDRPGNYKTIIMIKGEDGLTHKFIDYIKVDDVKTYIEIGRLDYDNQLYYEDDYYREDIYYGQYKKIRVSLIDKGNRIECGSAHYEIKSSSDIIYQWDRENCHLKISIKEKTSQLERFVEIKAKYENLEVKRYLKFNNYELVSSLNFKKNIKQERYVFEKTNTPLDGAYFHFFAESLDKEENGIVDIYKINENGHFRMNLRESSAEIFSIFPNQKNKIKERLKRGGHQSFTNIDISVENESDPEWDYCVKDNCRYDFILK